MPKLWSDTIADHRSAVLDAILDATAEVVHRNGVTGLTMTALAEKSGVGRATLYRYVPDVAAALVAWQQREISRHLQRLHAISSQSSDEVRLENVLVAYARIRSHRHGDDGSLHGTGQLAMAENEVRELLRDIIADDVRDGRARADLSPEELAAYAVGSVSAAGSISTPSAAPRLAALVLESIRSGSDAEDV
ncbi:TetR/AcrR family transcriptional regulator [Microbacterium sp. B2969]|uniref:TetR/AcrR family transcriptional regulator n=1 Tax=Microbacterium alkaliflavum TaxID=3248839 RepID=A0ABW7Q9G9_9MICO